MKREQLSTNEHFIKAKNPLTILFYSLKIINRVEYAINNLPLPIETTEEKEAFLKRYTNELESRG